MGVAAGHDHIADLDRAVRNGRGLAGEQLPGMIALFTFRPLTALKCERLDWFGSPS